MLVFLHPQKNLFLKIFQTWYIVYFSFEIFTVAKQYNHHHLRLQNGLLVSIVNPLSTFQWFRQWTQNLVWPVCIYFHFTNWVYTSDCSQQQWLNRLFCEYQNSTILSCPTHMGITALSSLVCCPNHIYNFPFRTDFAHFHSLPQTKYSLFNLLLNRPFLSP